MPLPSPKLDDRTFQALLTEAQRLIQQKGGNWTELSPSDPGVVLLELFAFLTEVMIYRLNRVPEKAYIEFLNLLGIKLQSPAAASVELIFYRSQPTNETIDIPRGSRVTIGRTSGGQEPPIFMTAHPAQIKAGEVEVAVRAYHCEQIDGEVVGKGNGLPSQSYTVSRPPIIAPTGDPLELIVGVEVSSAELDQRIAAVQFQGKSYRIWQEVEHFTNLSPTDCVYVVDRHSGQITFAPSLFLFDGNDSADSATLLAAAPALGREIRVWYRRGGGEAGNVAEEKLTTLKDNLVGVKVTNRTRATGGKSAESLANALQRGPQELHSLQRAVTAKDFELIARNYSGRAVSRAKAFTRAELWQHAVPGHVELLIVPDLPATESQRVTLELLNAHETATAIDQIRQAVDQRRPLGTHCIVNYARYKKVKVKSKIVAHREEDVTALQARIVRRLYQTITPLPTEVSATGWRFGQALRVSDLYDIALREPGVRWVESVRLLVEDVPDKQIGAIAIDHFQPQTWYVGSENRLYRSLNNGDGWELLGQFEGKIVSIQAHPGRPGWVAVANRRPTGDGSLIRISADCGESWSLGTFATSFNSNDLAWTFREGLPTLLLAADAGLFEIVIKPKATPVQILVDPLDQTKGFNAVIAYTDMQGIVTVTVTAQKLGGVWLSNNGGRPNTFRRVSQNLPSNEDVHELAVQYDGPRAFLWLSVWTDGNPTNPGNGCYRWELRGAQDPPEGWVNFKAGWDGGSCKGIAFHKGQVYAASHRLGVLRLDTTKPNPTWVPPTINSGLPLRDLGAQRLFHPVEVIDASPDQSEAVIIAGGAVGIYRTVDNGVNYASASSKEFAEKVTLPQTWLFISDEHEIEVISEDETI